jgi:ribokinase
MIGRVGDDAFGQQLIASLKEQGIQTEHVQVTPNCPSGLALIGVEDSGQNAITVIAGANERLTPSDVLQCEARIKAAECMLLQLEVPLETVVAAVQMAKKHGVFCILDPAPAPSGPLPAELYQVDLITPNQTEAEALTAIAVATPSDAVLAATVLHERGAPLVIVKLGEQGALLSERGREPIHVAAPKVEVVDTTGAGDAFTAALGASRLTQWAMKVRFACAAGALTTTRRGAQEAMPSHWTEVERIM